MNSSERAAAGTEALYPFLYGKTAQLGDVIEELARSTREKLAEVAELRRRLGDDYCSELAACADAIAHRFSVSGRLLIFGNGGSSTDAAALATLFMGPPWGESLPALSLASDTPLVTALANDVGFDVVFSRQIANLGSSNDVVIALSTSGGSPNVLAGLAEAHRLGMLTIGLAGYGGGRMAEEGTTDFLFAVPSSSVHRIQEAQTTLYHELWELVQARRN